MKAATIALEWAPMSSAPRSGEAIELLIRADSYAEQTTDKGRRLRERIVVAKFVRLESGKGAFVWEGVDWEPCGWRPVEKMAA